MVLAKKVGIIGITGRMGSIVSSAIASHGKYEVGTSFSRTTKTSIDDVFVNNDYVIDFSSSKLFPEILASSLKHPKPLAICSTGWSKTDLESKISAAAKLAPIVIAPNTSIGIYLQNYLVKQLSQILDQEFDIDITDQHHRNKVDIPSGTSLSLLETIKTAKKQSQNLDYTSYPLTHGPRPELWIGMHEKRSGNIIGEHEVSFVGQEEMLVIKHTGFSRQIYAKGAIKIIEWFDNNSIKPGLYNMSDVLDAALASSKT